MEVLVNVFLEINSSSEREIVVNEVFISEKNFQTSIFMNNLF